jgi:RimJ/RimL family protein N-acetyltransferase
MVAARGQAHLSERTYRWRKAHASDARALWEWANDPECRKQSFRSNPIPWKEHAQWFAAKMSSSSSLIVILETAEGKPAGQIRFDETPEGLTIDLALGPPFRGRGLGKTLLQAGMEAAAWRWTPTPRLIARVLQTNERSRGLFSSSGFVATNEGTMAGKPYVQFERTWSDSNP